MSQVSTLRKTGQHLLGPFAARLLTYPITIGCSLVTAALLIRGASVEDYAGYTLIASLLPILAFLDLGYGGAVTNWSAEYSNQSESDARNILRSRLGHALRAAMVPTFLGLILALVSSVWALATGSYWLHIPIAVLSLVLAIYSLNIPFSIISKILIGTGRTSTWIFIQIAQPLTALGFIGAAVWLKFSALIPIAPALSLLVMCTIGAYFGLKSAEIAQKDIVGAVVGPKQRGENLFASAWPMMIILIANPLALSSDRLILTWLSDTTNVASYSLASQLFSPALALLSATGLSLWPHFAKKRFRGETTGPWPMMFAFASAAVLGSLVLFCLSPWLANLVGGDRIELSVSLILCLASSFIVQAAQLPIGMYMMHGSGPKIQALLLVLMFALKFVLSVAFIPSLGAGGPALGTAIAILVCQILPGAWLVARRVV